MMKTDKRISNTEGKIKAAFFTMLEREPMHKISVKELCEIAQINRSTFYDHYSDIYALLDAVEEDCFMQMDVYTDAAIRAYLSGDAQQHARVLEEMLRFIKDHNKTFYSLRKHSEENHFELHLIEYASRQVEEAIGLKDEYERYSLLFHVTGSFTVLLRWMESGYALSVEEMARVLIRGGML